MTPAGRESGHDVQAVAGLRQVSRTRRARCGAAPRAVVDDRDTGRGAAPPPPDLKPAALARAGTRAAGHHAASAARKPPRPGTARAAVGELPSMTPLPVEMWYVRFCSPLCR